MMNVVNAETVAEYLARGGTITRCPYREPVEEPRWEPTHWNPPRKRKKTDEEKAIDQRRWNQNRKKKPRDPNAPKRVVSEETRRRMSEARKKAPKRPHTADTKEKLRAASLAYWEKKRAETLTA